MTRAYLYSSNLSMIWWYAATKCAIYVINRLPRPPHKSPIETFSGKPWDMSRLQPFGCMCHYHIPKLLRGASAALKPTSTAGIFVGYSLTSHKYAIFVFSTGAVVERSRVYFSPDVFPDDLGGVVSHTNRSTRNTTPGPTFSITTATADGDNPTDDETTEPTSVIRSQKTMHHHMNRRWLSRTMIVVKRRMTVLIPKQRATTTPSHTMTHEHPEESQYFRNALQETTMWILNSEMVSSSRRNAECRTQISTPRTSSPVSARAGNRSDSKQSLPLTHQ